VGRLSLELSNERPDRRSSLELEFEARGGAAISDSTQLDDKAVGLVVRFEGDTGECCGAAPGGSLSLVVFIVIVGALGLRVIPSGPTSLGSAMVEVPVK